MPIPVRDKATGQTIEVPSAEAQRGLQQGDYDAVDSTLRVADGNRTGKVSSADLLIALGQGARLIDDDEAAAISMRREQSDAGSQFVGGVEQLAAGATLGLSTKLEEALGANPEEMALRREALGGLGTALEIGGAIVPSMLSGGASLAAGGARMGVARTIARNTPAGLVTRAGTAIEARAGATLGNTAARRVVAGASGQLAEGMAYGAGVELHESVLGQREMQAEHVLAGGLMGAALGGATSAVLPGITRIAAGASELPAKAARKVLGSIGDLPQNVGELSQSWARTAAKVSGGDEAKFLRAAGYATSPQKRAFAHRALNNYDGVLAETTTGIVGAVTHAKGALDDAIDAVSGANHLTALESKIPKNADFVAPRIVANDLTTIDRRLAEIEALHMKRGGYDINAIVDMRQRITTAIAEAAERPGAAGAYRAANRLKQDFDLLIRKRGKGMIDTATRDTLDEFRSMAGTLRKNLEREDLWGAAGLMQQERNLALSRSLRKREELGGRGTVMGRMLDRTKDVSPADALALAKSHGKMAGAGKTAKLDEALEADLEVLRMAKKHYELAPEMVKKIDDAESAVAEMRRKLVSQAENSEFLEVVGHLRAVEGGGSPSIGLASTVGPAVAQGVGKAIGAGVGALAGGPVGAVIGHGVGEALGTLVGAATRPYTTFRTMIAIGHAADKAGVAIDARIGQFLGRMRGSKAPKAIAERGRVTTSRSSSNPRALTRTTNAASSRSDKRERLHSLRRRAIAAASNPGMLADEMELALYDTTEVAPGIAESITAKAQVAAVFLASKAPPSYQPPFSSSEPVIDSVALAQFERFCEGVEDPIGCFDKLAKGTLTVEHAEALRVVWPAIYESAQSSIMDELALAQAEQRNVPFRERMSIGTLFDIVTDPSLEPATFTALQGVWTAPPEQQMQPPRVLASPNAALSSSHMTAAQRISAGRSKWS